MLGSSFCNQSQANKG